MAISDLDKKNSTGEVGPKPGGVGLAVNMRREVGDSEYEPSLKELFSKGMKKKNQDSHWQRKGDQKKDFFFF